MPRSNKRNMKTETIPTTKQNKPKCNVRSRRKSNMLKKSKRVSNWTPRHLSQSSQSSSDSELLYIPPGTESHLQQDKPHENKCKLSGKKRKRSLEYHSDFDDNTQYQRNNENKIESVDISYKLPVSQRLNSKASNAVYSVGQSVYLIFQEYCQKYNECKSIIAAINALLCINDDIECLFDICQNTGYVDGEIISILKPSFVELGDDWLLKMIKGMDVNDVDIIECLRNWRIIVVQIADTRQQVIIHEISDNDGVSHLAKYLISDTQFLQGIQSFNRGDIVRFGEDNKLGKILEISAYDMSAYTVSPYKCLGIVDLNNYNKMNIFADGGYFRCSPWEINTKVGNVNENAVENDTGYDYDAKRQMINFIKCELINILPWNESIFDSILHKFKQYVADYGEIFHPNKSLTDLQIDLYAIKRELSYKYLCADEKNKNKYNREFIDIIERIIYLSTPNQQENLLKSVRNLAFPSVVC